MHPRGPWCDTPCCGQWAVGKTERGRKSKASDNISTDEGTPRGRRRGERGRMNGTEEAAEGSG